MEEAAAREIQTSRFGEMDPGDFVLSDDDDEEELETTSEWPDKSKVPTGKGIVKLLPKQRRKYLKLQHPELIPISSHLSEVITRHQDSTKVILNAVLESKETAKVSFYLFVVRETHKKTHS